jgi:hypothetical protein
MSNLAFNITARFTSRAVAVLKEKVAHLNRRAARLGCEKIALTVGEGVHKELSFAGPHGYPVSVFAMVYDCTVAGSVPVVDGGWEVMARLNVDQQGVQTFDLVAPGVDVTALPADVMCQHCNKVRSRRCIYFLKGADGQVIRVGSTCLESFLGCQSPAAYAWNAEAAWIHMMVEGDDSYGEDGWLSGGTRVEMFPTDTVIGYAVRACADDGYISRSRAGDYDRATVDRVSDMLMLGQVVELTGVEVAIVAKVREAVAAMGESEYAFNVKSVIAAEYVTRRNLGIAASAVSVLERHQREQRAAAITRVNEHVGQAGERIELDVILEGHKVTFSDWGESCLYRLRSTEGHSLVWWCSGGRKESFEEAAEAGSFKVKATVKRHGEFNGLAQTTVNRVSVVA